jgi:hypothetical protein
MSAKEPAPGGGGKGPAETVEERNQRWKAGGIWKFLNVQVDGVNVTYTREVSDPTNLVWVKRSDLPDDIFHPVETPSTPKRRVQPAETPSTPKRRVPPPPAASSALSESEESEDEPPVPIKSDAKPGVSLSKKGKAPGKKQATLSSSEESGDSDAKSQRRSATPPPSPDKRTRPQSRVNYSEELAPEALQEDDQQLLADACEKLKKNLWQMGMGLSAADAHEKVLDFLLGDNPQLKVDTSTVSGHGGFTTCAVKTGTVLGLLTSEYHANRNLRPKGPRISGIRYKADESWYMAGWVNSCCLVHARQKKRRKENVCPSNAEFRVFIVHGDEGVVRYVVLLAICDIEEEEEVFAYYALRRAGPAPGLKDDSDLVDAASDPEVSEEDASAAGAPAAGASKQRARTFRGRRIKHGITRSDDPEQGDSSKRESKARDAAASAPRRGQTGFQRCRGGGSSRGARDGGSAAPSKAVALAAAKTAMKSQPTASSSSSSSSSSSEDDSKEVLVDPPEESVPESMVQPHASHSAGRGQANW